MNIISALAVIVMFINMSAGTYVLKTDPSHKMNRLFFLQCVSLAVWALTAAVIYSSHDKNQIILWYKISSFGFALYYAFTLHLFLLFTRARLSLLKTIAMYIPSAIIIAMTWFSYTLFEDFILTDAGCKFIPAFSRAGFYIYTIYYFSFAITLILKMIKWQRSAESRKEKHQSRIVVPSCVTTVTLCTTTDFILPAFPFYHLPALAPVLLVINTGAILYAIYKYNFLTPVTDIFNNSYMGTYPGKALLLNKRQRVITVNNEFCEYFSCTKDDISGMHINRWFSPDNLLINELSLLASGQAKTGRGTLKYGSRRNSLFIADCSVIKDKFGDFIGILIIINPAVKEQETGTSPVNTTSIQVFNKPADGEKMTVDKPWGIDLAGRKMRHDPWPVDKNGHYCAPSSDETESTYCISGEAVNETLLYFEECGGDAESLVFMLNEHFIDSRFMIKREELLDKTRWYTNEFYFYFIMFTKKVIGRYDFHFGENSDEQLSMHHKIYEKGFMEYIPYGKTESGEPVQDVTTNNVLGLLLYLEKVMQISTSDVITFINYNMNPRYSINRDFYDNENIWCSLEFIEYGLEFTKIIANDKNFFINAAVYSTLNELRLGKLFFLIPRKVVLSQLKSGISKVNNIHNFKIDIGPGFARFLISIKPDFNINKYSKYLNASIPNDSAIYHGALSGVLKLMFGLDKLPASTLIINDSGNTLSFTIEYRWRPSPGGIYQKIIAGIAVSFITGFGLTYSGLFIHCITLGFLVLFIIYLYEKKKNLSGRFHEYTMVSNQQLEALEKTSAELLEERNTLEQKVIARTKELALANEKLSELDRVKSNFFANISHEIRTPLTLMITPIEAVLNGGYDYRQEKGFFESIYNNGLRLLSLINNLLDFSRIDAGNIKMSICCVDIAAMAAAHIEAVRSVCELRRIELLSHFQAKKIMLYADMEKIDRILANLLSNAIKFTGSGGRVSLTIKSEGTGYCVISIADTGPGIPVDKLEGIFDRFSQVDSGPARRFEGTGIGLALVKEYTELHKGSVSVESRYIESFPEKHGSVFTVKIPAGKYHFQERSDIRFTTDTGVIESAYTLPYAELSLPGQREDEPVSIPDAVSQFENTILIVEDNPGMHTMLNEILGSQYRIISANNGIEAMEILQHEENMPDLVLADVMMPGMDGYELTAKIRQIPGLDSVPVILLTAKAGPEMKLEGFARGASDYIIKPFNTRELRARIRAQLDLKAVRDRLERANRQLYSELKNRHTRKSAVSESSEMKIRHVIEFIDKNFSADISREGLAAAVDMSPDHLSRTFNKLTGKRLDVYINELRIRKARSELSETEKTILEIAMNSGFENLRSFNRIFRESEGMTPSEYRGRNRINQ